MDNIQDITPFPADIAEMVLNNETRHPSLQSGQVFVEVTITDNGSENMRYRICYVGPIDIYSRHYNQLAVSTYAADMRDVAKKLRDGYFTNALLNEAATMRDESDAEQAIIDSWKEAHNG